MLQETLQKGYEFTETDISYLKSLAKHYPTPESAITEIINLRAIMALPKGTEHFLSDIHGEYQSFIHVLKTASGVIRRKIDDVFRDILSEEEKRSLATLIYYPEEKLELLEKEGKISENWYRVTLYRLIKICRIVTAKYTRSKVRKALPQNFGYIIEELLHENEESDSKQEYYIKIIQSIIEIGSAREFIISICNLIQRLSVDRMHILGDIYDRGPGADIILDRLMDYHSLDIQWGNHDILWLGAAAGSLACIATAMRISLRYGNVEMLREGYGIDTTALATFAHEFYKNDSCCNFIPKSRDESVTEREAETITKMHKAISIIEFKLVAQLLERRKEFQMADRIILDRINWNDYTLDINDNTYSLNDRYWPTVNPKNPYDLIPEEEEVMRQLRASFCNSEKLQKHAKFLLSKGSMYKCYNGNLLFHGCIPMNSDGTFKTLYLDGKELSGKKLMDWFDNVVRSGYFSKDKEWKEYAQDIMWYLWAGADSPLFGKNKMTTFERYFIDDKSTHHEEKNPYFAFRDNIEICKMILSEFGLDPDSGHIINGHVPVKVKKGENPVKADGKLLVIDGGFAKAYQKETGIAGYTLIFNSHGLILTAHKPFESTQKAIQEELDVIPDRFVIEKSQKGICIADTDIGNDLKLQVKNLEKLVEAYRRGLI